MTDPDLSDLLERAGDRTHVGPPPIAAMVAGARRRRRRRTMMAGGGAAAAVVLTVGGAALFMAPGIDPLQPAGPTGSPSADASTSPPSTPAGGLEGTWTVEALVGLDGQSLLSGGHRGTLVLTFADGEVRGFTNCNSIFGSYRHGGEDGRDLRFPQEDLGSTTKYCSDEPPLLQRLLDVRHVSGSGDVRRLHAENWMIIAELRRSDASDPVPCSGVMPAGCGKVISAGDVTVLVSEAPRAGLDALGGGRIEVVGGCLGASGSVIVWPHGTRVVDTNPVQVHVPSQGSYSIGDSVRLEGGYVLEHSSDTVEQGPYEVGGVTVPPECAQHDIFLAH